MKKPVFLTVVIVVLVVVAVGIWLVVGILLPRPPVKIGMLIAHTGALAPFGPPIQHGADLAVEQINKAGGIMGRELDLIVRDTATAPAVGRDAAAKLIEIDGVPAIVGALSSGVTLASSSVSIPNETILISPASTSPAITDLEDNDFVFRTTVSDAFQGLVQADLALDLGYKTVSVIYVNNAYGKGLAEVFKKAFEAKGGKVLAMVPYEEGKPSYRGELEQVIRGNPNALNVIAYPVDGNKQLVQTIELGYEGKFLFCDGVKGEAVAAGPASKFIEGSFGTAAGTLEILVAEQFTADFNQRFEPSTVPYNREAYDAAVLIALAMWKAGPSFFKMSRAEQGKTIRDNLRAVANPPGEEVTYGELEKAFDLLKEGKDVNYQGVSGPIGFDENGDINAGAIEIWVIKESKVVTERTVKVGM